MSKVGCCRLEKVTAEATATEHVEATRQLALQNETLTQTFKVSAASGGPGKIMK